MSLPSPSSVGLGGQRKIGGLTFQVVQGTNGQLAWDAITTGTHGARIETLEDGSIQQMTVAQAQASALQVGQYVRLIDRELGLFKVTNDVANTYDIIDIGGNSLTYVYLNGVVHLDHLQTYDSGTTACDGAITRAKAIMSLAGGELVFRRHGSYRIESAHAINSNYLTINVNDAELTRTVTATSGFMFHWALNNNTEGGGIHSGNIYGVRNPDSGNGGVAFGTDVNYANFYNAYDLRLQRWGQYGFAAYNGSNWHIRNIRVLEHGHNETAISSCIGFNIFPRLSSANGRLSDIHSVIASDTIANCAAMKIQTHRNLQGNQLFAQGGSEITLSIDSITGKLTNLTARAQSGTSAGRPGVAVISRSSAHNFVGAYTIDGLDCDDLGFGLSMVIGAGLTTDTFPVLSNCTLKNIACRHFQVLNRSSWQSCNFENITASGTFRLDHAQASVIVPTIGISNNFYKNCSGATFEVAGSNSEFTDCMCRELVTLLINGDDNTLNSMSSINATGNGITVNGNRNVFANLLSSKATGRTIWVQAGDANVFHGLTVGGVVMLDNGTNTDTTGLTQV